MTEFRKKMWSLCWLFGAQIILSGKYFLRDKPEVDVERRDEIFAKISLNRIFTINYVA